MNLRPQTLALVSFGTGLVIGGAVSFFVTKHFVQEKERAIATDEIEQIKNHYRIVRKEGDLADPEKLIVTIKPAPEMVDEEPENSYGEQHRGENFNENYPVDQEELERVAAKIADLGYEKAQAIIGQADDEQRDLEDVIDEHLVIEEARHSVFENGISEADVKSIRTPERPYIITFEEWANPDEGFEDYEMPTMKYYASDNQLLDSMGGMVAKNTYDELVGVGNLQRFGHNGAQDENMLYVRNEQMSLSIEIERHNESYVESLGLHLAEDEEPRRKRKTRPED